MEHCTIKGAILDMDGTILDSMGMWRNLDAVLLAEFGVEHPPKQLSDTVRKMTIEESSQYFVDTFGLDVTPEQITRRVEELAADAYCNTLQLKEGVPELLDAFDRRGIAYGIATATYPELARAALKRLGILDRLQFLVTEAETGLSKNQPEIFYQCSRKLSLGKRQVLVAEDSLHALLTAKQAGFFTVGVYDPWNPMEDWKQICAQATISVNRLQDLPQLL